MSYAELKKIENHKRYNSVVDEYRRIYQKRRTFKVPGTISQIWKLVVHSLVKNLRDIPGDYANFKTGDGYFDKKFKIWFYVEKIEINNCFSLCSLAEKNIHRTEISVRACHRKNTVKVILVQWTKNWKTQDMLNVQLSRFLFKRATRQKCRELRRLLVGKVQQDEFTLILPKNEKTNPKKRDY